MDISSITIIFKNLYLLRIASNSLSEIVEFCCLTGICNAECKVVPLIPEAAVPVEAVNRIDG